MHGGLVWLKSERPSFDTSRWFRVRVAIDSNEGLVVCVDIDWLAVNVEVKVFTCPYYSEGFALSLAVALLGGGQRPAGICNDTLDFGCGIDLR